jgi:hypothetical protein
VTTFFDRAFVEITRWTIIDAMGEVNGRRKELAESIAVWVFTVGDRAREDRRGSGCGQRPNVRRRARHLLKIPGAFKVIESGAAAKATVWLWPRVAGHWSWTGEHARQFGKSNPVLTAGKSIILTRSANRKW